MATARPTAELFAEWRQWLRDGLKSALPAAQSGDVVAEAMRYSALGQSKQLRPLLVYATAHCLQTPPTQLTPLAIAVECIHTYSLIHDDLPAMDNAAMRRNQPSCHRQFGEATALLAGDALQPLAFELLAALPVDDSTHRQISTEFARICGRTGLVRGQMLDLAAEENTCSLEQIEEIHALKTALLIETCVRLAALACGEAPESAAMQSLRAYGRAFGLGFQARDDLLDLVASSSDTGKDAAADIANKKANCAGLIGTDATLARIGKLRQQAARALEPLGDRAACLHLLLHNLLDEDTLRSVNTRKN